MVINHRRPIMKLLSLLYCLSFCIFNPTFAQTDTSPTDTSAPKVEPVKPETSVKKDPVAARQEIEKRVEEKYSITPEKLTELEKSGLKLRDIVSAAALAKEGNKSLDEILQMRGEGKKGWGEIAKELNVSPDIIGKAISDLRRRNPDDKNKRKDDKKGDNKDDSKDDKKEERKEERKDDKKEERRDDHRQERRDEKRDEHRDQKREERKDDRPRPNKK